MEILWGCGCGKHINVGNPVAKKGKRKRGKREKEGGWTRAEEEGGESMGEGGREKVEEEEREKQKCFLELRGGRRLKGMGVAVLRESIRVGRA